MSDSKNVPSRGRKRTNLIKTMLKNSFPDTRFSVKTGRGSTSESIEINWIDGPTEEQVEEQTKLRHHFENVDRCEITNEILLGGNTYFFYNRTYSNESIELCRNAVRRFMSPHPSDAKKGQWWIDQWVQTNAWRIWKITDFRKVDPENDKVYGLTNYGSKTYMRFRPQVPAIPTGATHVIDGSGFHELAEEEKESGKTGAELEKRWFKNTDWSKVVIDLQDLDKEDEDKI